VRAASVVGDFNGWDPGRDRMQSIGGGVWHCFVAELHPGALYKFAFETAEGKAIFKADPFAFRSEVPPGTASIVHQPRYQVTDEAWLRKRGEQEPSRRPLAIYEVHLGSWRRVPEEGGRVLGYRELAPLLIAHVRELGFTHVELLPVMEHPFGGSWGYQVTAFYAPTARHGDPDDFRFLVDQLHAHDIGVILDWVPAHFPKDTFALGRFDGTALYEHLDARQGEHPDWGTYIFNYARHEVRNFLIANALFWLEEYHVDGLRLDAVASMLYLDYSRAPGHWVPNEHGGRENLGAIDFLRELNVVAHAHHPGVMMIAEESTAWPAVSRPTYVGGLGFGFKWNMGWMHDVLAYFALDPVFRRHHHQLLTFGLLYAFSENFILPLSHDEVVYGKGSLLAKMAGDRWQQLANLRALYGYMWAHPGKKLLFMGGEFAQPDEWNHDRSLAWHLIADAGHRGVMTLVHDLNRVYHDEPPLWTADAEPAGFHWIDVNNADENVVAFVRRDPTSGRQLLCVGNFSPVVRQSYRVGLPRPGRWREVLNTDAAAYGGSNVGNLGGVESAPTAMHGQPYSASLVLPPLAVLWLTPDEGG
jgi:1,4-alpha-glucan branching enzyme